MQAANASQPKGNEWEMPEEFKDCRVIWVRHAHSEAQLTFEY